MRKKVERPIEITVVQVNGESELSLNPDALEAYKGDVVVWSWKSVARRAFAVIFTINDTPFPKRKFSSGKNIIKQTINFDPGKHRVRERSFKYTIAGYHNGNVLILDPEIIVKRPPRP
jgi:hypothetical protein